MLFVLMTIGMVQYKTEWSHLVDLVLDFCKNVEVVIDSIVGIKPITGLIDLFDDAIVVIIYMDGLGLLRVSERSRYTGEGSSALYMPYALANPEYMSIARRGM